MRSSDIHHYNSKQYQASNIGGGPLLVDRALFISELHLPLQHRFESAALAQVHLHPPEQSPHRLVEVPTNAILRLSGEAAIQEIGKLPVLHSQLPHDDLHT